MAIIYTPCPHTGRAISTGIETDEATFAAMPQVITRVHCPYCGEQHNWSKYNAFLIDPSRNPGTERDSEG